MKTSIYRAIVFPIVFVAWITATAQSGIPSLQFTVSIPNPEKKAFHVQVDGKGWNKDTVEFKLPKWMPGYYQIMDYARSVENFAATDKSGKKLPVMQPD